MRGAEMRGRIAGCCPHCLTSAPTSNVNRLPFLGHGKWEVLLWLGALCDSNGTPSFPGGAPRPRFGRPLGPYRSGAAAGEWQALNAILVQGGLGSFRVRLPYGLAMRAPSGRVRYGTRPTSRQFATIAEGMSAPVVFRHRRSCIKGMPQ